MGIRVVVIDDNPHVIQLVTDGLREGARRELGGGVVFEFVVARNGAEGLAALKQGPFDAVITDIYLPVMDGAQFMRELRGTLGPSLPILAISAGGAAARELAMQAGCNRFLDKPLRLSDLIAALKELLKL